MGLRLADPVAGDSDATTLAADADGLATVFDELAAIGIHDTIVWSLSKSLEAIDRIATDRRRPLGGAG